MAHLAKKSLNELLVNLFNHVMDLEAKAVITEEYCTHRFFQWCLRIWTMVVENIHIVQIQYY